MAIRLGTDEHDTEDKSYWVNQYGTKKEIEFCNLMNSIGGYSTIPNPSKQFDKYAPDILVNGALSDLKYCGTPFYTARKYHGLDPQFVITFDDKDYLRYKSKYPEILIYFWVEYPDASGQFGGESISIRKVNHIFEIPFNRMMQYIELGGIPHHTYKRRLADEIGNSRGSYLFDIRSMKCIFKGTDVNV